MNIKKGLTICERCQFRTAVSVCIGQTAEARWGFTALHYLLLHDYTTEFTACMQAATHLNPNTCTKIAEHLSNLTSNITQCQTNLSLTLHMYQQHMGPASNYSGLVTFLLILTEVQGTFNQKSCSWGIIFQACVVTGWEKNGENLLLCMDLRIIMKQRKYLTPVKPFP